MNSLNSLTVTKFNSIIKDIFNAEELLHNVKIVGEVFGISNARTSVYFSLKDEESSLPCISFNSDILSELKEGDSVIVTGSPNFYVKQGRFSFIVAKIEPYGQGILYQKFLELKDKLEKDGIFDETHKKPIPTVIKRIGVVTSKDGAVIQDIKNVAWRRNPSVDIVLYSVKVQGNGAENEIVKGIEFFSKYEPVDVVIVARGGGSLEDLSAFNSEQVARAVYACEKPLVSAVGHETDFTIIDFASDLRAPTPSAAAELLTKDSKNAKAVLNKDTERLSRLLQAFLANKQMEFEGDKNIILSLMEGRIINSKNKLQKIFSKLSTKIDTITINADYSLKLQLAKVNKLNPLDILRLGYAKIEQKGKPIGKAAELKQNEKFEIYFADDKVDIVPRT